MVEYMPVVTKYIKAGDLPSGWGQDFPDPGQMVSVTVADIESAPTGHKIDLAAPSRADKAALAAMGDAGQTALYEQAILTASAQPGERVSPRDIKAAAKLPHHG